MFWPFKKKKTDTRLENLEKQLSYFRTLYAAAKNTRLTGRFGIPVAGEDINDIIGQSADIVGARVQQLVRDFPIFARAVEMKAAHVVGSGIIYQSRIRKSNSQLNQAQNNEIEYWFNKWADTPELCDIAGRLTFWEMQDLAVRQKCELGEYLKVKHVTKTGLKLQVIEPSQIDSSVNTTKPVRTVNGIELDQYGKPTGIWIKDTETFQSTKIPASKIIHGFKTLRPGQVRGISQFASAILLSKDLADLMESELGGAKMASKWLAFITRNDLGGIYGTETDSEGKVIEDLENGIIEYLNQGESVQLASSNRPGNNFSPFVRLLIQFASAATGVPYELLSADYSGMNYTVLRGVRNDFAHALKPESEAIIRQLCWPVFIEWLKYDPNVRIRDKLTNIDKYTRGQWVVPPMAQIDPLKENKAWIEAINAGLRSPQEFFAENGREIEDVYGEIKAAQDLRESMGIMIETNEPSTSSSNSPSALYPDEEI